MGCKIEKEEEEGEGEGKGGVKKKWSRRKQSQSMQLQQAPGRGWRYLVEETLRGRKKSAIISTGAAYDFSSRILHG